MSDLASGRERAARAPQARRARVRGTRRIVGRPAVTLSRYLCNPRCCKGGGPGARTPLSMAHQRPAKVLAHAQRLQTALRASPRKSRGCCSAPPRMRRSVRSKQVLTARSEARQRGRAASKTM